MALSVLTIGTKLLAQVESQGTLMELKKVPIAPSPNASAIGKFGEIPFSLSTGIPINTKVMIRASVWIFHFVIIRAATR